MQEQCVSIEFPGGDLAGREIPHGEDMLTLVHPGVVFEFFREDLRVVVREGTGAQKGKVGLAFVAAEREDLGGHEAGAGAAGEHLQNVQPRNGVDVSPGQGMHAPAVAGLLA